MKKFINKRIEKFKKQSLFGKLLDILLIILIVLLIFPSTRKQLLTYTSSLRMYLSSVDEKEQGESALKGKSSILIIDSKGEQYTLNDFTDKPVFINYWATWCPPCRAEMPALEKLYNEYKNEVYFLFITREPFSKTTEFTDKAGYSLPVYRLKSKPEGVFEYQALPTSLLISDSDQLIFKKEGLANWHSNKIKDIFDKTIAKDT